MTRNKNPETIQCKLEPPEVVNLRDEKRLLQSLNVTSMDINGISHYHSNILPHLENLPSDML